jgi:DNA-binding NtrC family response regulator
VNIPTEPHRSTGPSSGTFESSAAAQGTTPSPSLSDLFAPSSMAGLRREALAALHGSSPILILGESGSGKTWLAHALADASSRRPVVRAMLGGSDDLNTMTSELFGHERGAFSGATAKRVGLVEFAHRGTLVLDELLNLPMHAQKLLLDFTQFGTYRPLGYDRPEPKRADVRIVAATNGDLRAAMRDGRLRQDLFYRLAGVVLELPPLRSRRDDIPLLAAASLRRADPSRGWNLSSGLLRLLASPTIEWSGNLRQLDHVLSRARCRAVAQNPAAQTLLSEHVEARDLDGEAPMGIADAPADAREGAELDLPHEEGWQRLQVERQRLDAREATMIRRALAEADGVVARAARQLGLARTTLASRVEQLGIRSERATV